MDDEEFYQTVERITGIKLARKRKVNGRWKKIKIVTIKSKNLR
jgi:hypothetical protein